MRIFGSWQNDFNPKTNRQFIRNVLADDAALTATRLDRLLHHGHIVSLRRQSYRLKDKKRAGSAPVAKATARSDL